MSNRLLLSRWRERWNRNLLRFLGKHARAAVDIEDLAQETYLRLLRAPDLNQVRNPQAYLIRVASNVVIEWRHSQPPPGAFAAVDLEQLVDGITPDIELEAGLSQARIDQVLSKASPMLQAILLLRLRERQTYRDIALALGITERQVKRHLARGYERLREALEQ